MRLLQSVVYGVSLLSIVVSPANIQDVSYRHMVVYEISAAMSSRVLRKAPKVVYRKQIESETTMEVRDIIILMTTRIHMLN